MSCKLPPYTGLCVHMQPKQLKFMFSGMQICPLNELFVKQRIETETQLTLVVVGSPMH